MLLFSTKNIELPENIILIPLPPYSPELNPAEKMWQWFKDKIAMKMFKSVEKLEEKVTELIKNTDKEKIKSITSYPYLKTAYYGVFN